MYAVTHFEGQDQVDVTNSTRGGPVDKVYADETSIELLFLLGHPLSGRPQILVEKELSNSRRSCLTKAASVVGGLLWTGFSNFWVTLRLFGSSGDSSSATILVVCGLVTVVMFTLFWLVIEHKHDRINRDIAKHQTNKPLISEGSPRSS